MTSGKKPPTTLREWIASLGMLVVITAVFVVAVIARGGTLGDLPPKLVLFWAIGIGGFGMWALVRWLKNRT